MMINGKQISPADIITMSHTDLLVLQRYVNNEINVRIDLAKQNKPVKK